MRKPFLPIVSTVVGGLFLISPFVFPNLAEAATPFSASNVLGETGFVSNQGVLSTPGSSTYDPTNHRLFVSDFSNNRVVEYDLSSGITDGMNESHVLGQASFTTSTAATTKSGMSGPSDLAYDPATQNLFVVDSSNNRVLEYDLSSGVTDGMNASHVLGQSSFTTSTSATTQSGLHTSFVSKLSYDSSAKHLFVTDSSNNRVLEYDLSSGVTDGMNASHVLGQSSFTTNTSATTQSGLNNPVGMFYDMGSSHLFVGDGSNNRVLEYDLSSGVTDGMNASHVLGQSSFTTATSATTQSGMNTPYGVTYDSTNQRLFVTNLSNNRVLEYDLSSGVTDGMNASHVLGQSSFTTSAAATTQSGLNIPIGLSYDITTQHLFVADDSNNRVVEYDLSSGITDGMNAAHVLGQAGFVSNQNGVNVATMVAYDGTHNRLFVSDRDNNRILEFNLANGVTNGMNAEHVLGQADFTTTTATDTQAGLHTPRQLLYDSATQHLFVADESNNRVVEYDLSSGITDGMNASHVLGQSSFTTNTAAATQSGMNSPIGLSYNETNHQLFVSEFNNNRVVEYDLSSGITDGMNASHVLGQSSFTTNTAAATQSGMHSPAGMFYDGGSSHLFVADYINHRVLEYDLSSGITDGMNASHVLGQSSFTTNVRTVTQSGMAFPFDVLYTSDSQKLWVADGNNRVLEYDLSSGITDGMNATAVLGQTSYTTATSSNTSSGMYTPSSLDFDPVHHQLFVADESNNRVLIYTFAQLVSSLPTATVGSAYSAPLSSHTQGTVSYVVTSGTLPTGLTLDASSGALVGTPTTVGSSTFSISLSDNNGLAGTYTATQSYTLAVVAAPPAATPTTLGVSTIDGHAISGTSTISPTPTFSGTAPVGSKVTVTVHTTPVTCTATADSSGNWSCTLATALPIGNHTVDITATTPSGTTLTLASFPVVVASLAQTGTSLFAGLLVAGLLISAGVVGLRRKKAVLASR